MVPGESYVAPYPGWRYGEEGRMAATAEAAPPCALASDHER